MGLSLAAALALAGCVSGGTDATTPTVAPVVTQEVVVPIAACPKEINELEDIQRPNLPIDQLSSADMENYDKVGKAYIQTTEDLKMYAEQLEKRLKGVKAMCQSVNTAPPGTK